jgi:hypothetical protein
MTLSKVWARLKWMQDDAIMWAAAFVLSLAQWRHVVFFFSNMTQGRYDLVDLIQNVRAERGVVQGYPHWRYFQSRVLGPWIEQLLNFLFGFNFLAAHMIVAIVVLTLAGGVMFYTGRAIAGRQGGWSALLAFQTLFTLMMARPWLYIWDYFTLLATATFLLLVISRAPWWSFLLLMAGASFNHESALFIGVWMVAKALIDAWAEYRRPDWRMLWGGVFGSLCAVLLIEFLRKLLLKREIGWEIFSDVGKGPTSQLEGYFRVQIVANLQDWYQWVMHPSYGLLFLIPLSVILTLALAGLLVARHGIKAAPLAVYVSVQVAALLALGIRQETRNLLHLVPFLCIGGMLVAKPKRDGA